MGVASYEQYVHTHTCRRDGHKSIFVILLCCNNLCNEGGVASSDICTQTTDVH